MISSNNYCFYSTSKVLGEIDTEYKLHVNWKGNVFEASTSIPEIVILDSVWLETNNSTYGKSYITFLDPVDFNNYYRWQAQRISHYNDGTLKDLFYLSPNESCRAN